MDPISVLLILAIIALLFVFLLVTDRRIGSSDLLSPLFIVVSLIVIAYGIRPLFLARDFEKYATYAGYYHLGRDDIFFAAMLLALAGSVSLILGFSARGHGAIARRLPSLEIVSVHRLRNLSILFLAVGILAFASILPELLRSSTLSLFDTEARREVTALWKGRGHLMAVITNTGTFFILYLYSCILIKKTLPSLLIILPILLVCLFINGVIGSRAGFLGLILAIVLVRHYYVKKFSILSQIAVAMALPLLGGLLGLLLVGHFFGQEVTLGPLLFDILFRLSGTFDQFELFIASLNRSENFFFGLTFIEDLLFTYIPRAIFPFKPEIYGSLRLQDEVMPHLFSIAGLSATYPVGIFAEAYLNFFVLGVVLVPFAFGVFLRALYERAKDPNSLYGVVLVLLLASNVGIIRSLGGTLLATLFYIVFFKVVFCTRVHSAQKVPVP